MFRVKRIHLRRLALLTAAVMPAALLVSVQPAHAAEGGETIVANVLWRVAVGSRPDYMTTANPSERNQFPVDGQAYYLPKHQYGGTAPLYRLFHPNWGGHMDHMDSRTPGEGGFSTEAPVGYAYTSPGTNGTSQYYRTYNRCNYDHGNRSIYEAPKGCTGDEAIAGAYGWPRFGNSGWSPLALTAGGVTIESNRVAGGALFHWSHNGTQYINNFDYGRQMQSSLFFARDGKQANPTESGDRYSDPGWQAWRKHGSPLAAAYNADSKTQVTRSVPLDFEPQNFGGGEHNPVIYKDFQIGKDITLDWGGLGPVARYTTVLTSPALGYPGIELPTAYLRAEFNRYYTYDANSGALSEWIPQVTCSDNAFLSWAPPNRGGVIISNADGSKAMAVYGANKNVGGSVSEMRLYKFIGGGCGTGTGEYDIATSKFTVLRHGSVGSGTKYFNNWVMSGSVDQIKGYMNTLRSWGAA